MKAKWNWSVRRVSLAFVAFLPISFVLLLPMLTLGDDYFPWIEAMTHDPIVQNKAAYLNMPFLVARNVVGPGRALRHVALLRVQGAPRGSRSDGSRAVTLGRQTGGRSASRAAGRTRRARRKRRIRR